MHHSSASGGSVIAGRQETSIGRTGELLIALALLIVGCARGDWTTETLTLVDVSGTWEGRFRWSRGGSGGHAVDERTIAFVLQQKGQKVRGDARGLDGARLGTVEGLINGEAFSWRLTGALTPGRDSPASAYRGVSTVNGSDELSGQADGPGCPCSFVLRRVGTKAIREK